MGWKENLIIGVGLLAAGGVALTVFGKNLISAAGQAGSTVGIIPATFLGEAGSSFINTLTSYLPHANSIGSGAPPGSPGNPVIPGPDVSYKLQLTPEKVGIGDAGGGQGRTPGGGGGGPGSTTVPNPLTPPPDFWGGLLKNFQKLIPAPGVSIPGITRPIIPETAAIVQKVPNPGDLSQYQNLAAIWANATPLGGSGVPDRPITITPINTSKHLENVVNTHNNISGLSPLSMKILTMGFYGP